MVPNFSYKGGNELTIAIITARGGSKRLPRKNVKLFCGHPLVAWAIVQAKCSALINKVFVSTDDDEIEKISKEYGAEVIRRPDWSDANEAAANRPFCHAIGVLKEKYGDAFNLCLTILPTTPLNIPGQFDEAIRKFREIGADMIFPLRPLRETLIHKKLNDIRCRSFLFAKHYEYLGEGGGWCVCTPNWYLKINEQLPSDKDKELDALAYQAGYENYYITTQYWQYADVDTAEEFETAEVLMEHFILKGRGMDVYKDYYNKNSPLYPRGLLTPLNYTGYNESNYKDSNYDVPYDKPNYGKSQEEMK